jgi:hypothetical protein
MFNVVIRTVGDRVEAATSVPDSVLKIVASGEREDPPPSGLTQLEEPLLL